MTEWYGDNALAVCCYYLDLLLFVSMAVCCFGHILMGRERVYFHVSFSWMMRRC